MAQGIILAGGYSSRIGQNKMTLSYLGEPLICHCIKSMTPFVTDIFVVTGHYHQELLPILEKIPKVSVIYNEIYHQGMFTSVLAGVNHVTEDFFIIPGDYPNVLSNTYESLLDNKAFISVPVYQNKKGHPLFIKKSLIDDLRKEPLDSNLKVFRNRYFYEEVTVNDAGILQDIDTLKDLEQLVLTKE
ncbi:MAG: molybdopterin-guanine dinucleotide biosynthesis protein A [Tenericutes bacterium HGW-Tenericutes-1]|jgi:molybdenum cofactor cytidylyltransferase|nr:MAG: molybdopterin-guanine dinucleotide biosynthesis protein A [Tenericutes bacterium HGW-Tenericutes-1]